MSLYLGQLVKSRLRDPASEERQRLAWLREHAPEARLRRRLRRRFPELLRHLGDVPTFRPDEEPLSSYGIEFNAGWLPLFEKLCRQLVEATPPSRRRRFVVTQAKEKFGELRVHLEGANARMRSAVEDAKALSRVTCEDCGRPAERRERDGWYYTLCARHWRRRRDKAEQARAERRARFAREAASRSAKVDEEREREAARAKVRESLHMLINGTIRDFVDVGLVKRGGMDLDASVRQLVDEVLDAEALGEIRAKVRATVKRVGAEQLDKEIDEAIHAVRARRRQRWKPPKPPQVLEVVCVSNAGHERTLTVGETYQATATGFGDAKMLTVQSDGGTYAYPAALFRRRR